MLVFIIVGDESAAVWRVWLRGRVRLGRARSAYDCCHAQTQLCHMRMHAGGGVQDAEEHEPPCMNAARGSPESALGPTPSPPKVASEMVPGCDRAERRTLPPPSLVVPEVLQHPPPHMHAEDAHAGTAPRASGGPATEGTLLLHSQAPAAAPEAPSRSAVRGVDEVAAAGTWSAGDTESPSVKEVWETQCRGLSTRRRR